MTGDIFLFWLILVSILGILLDLSTLKKAERRIPLLIAYGLILGGGLTHGILSILHPADFSLLSWVSLILEKGGFG
jgi:multidrug transporter EmrE-like cation transporter